MCGIAGIVDIGHTQEELQRLAETMTATLAHRGPDAAATWSGATAALGHSRLQIIDAPGGAQPMRLHLPGQGHIVVCFNGEIYNFERLRQQLQSLGHLFTSRSDTEVVLHSYVQWGTDCFAHMDGIFAVAVWDERDRSLVLARDHLGVKPLYYARTGTGLIFGSEIKAILAAGVPAELDEQGVAELAQVPMISPGGAILRGIAEVRPATVAQFRDGRLTEHTYWTLTSRPHRDDLETTVRMIRALLVDAVRAQLVADRPVAALNSGGLDSATTAAIATAYLRDDGRDLHTFDVDHAADGTSYSGSAFHVDRDHPHALLVADHIKSVHHTTSITTDALLAAQDAALTAMDLPSLSTINISLDLLFRDVSVYAPVVLSGEGADEAWHGYRWYNDRADYATDDWPWHQTYRPVTPLLRQDVIDQADPLGYSNDRYHAALAEVPRLVGETGSARRIREVAWLTNTYYLPFLLRRADRMAMAHGVEVRVPFLSTQLFEYAWNVPPVMKGVDGVEKGLLRRAAATFLPREIAQRRKSGYPASLTLSYQRALWERARDLLAEPDAPVFRLFDRISVMGVLDKHAEDLSDWTPTQHIAYMLEVETWLRQAKITIR
ncbi:asparagine synthase (glutamine-hydrolyzing) [Hamadaea tsunoensis]|uniref:asparagine synthase (glutamine-hydrolyzing) n=1 Tax=Hamadaea tsunoensis TaxID=53368 RepID=UPI0004059126|nr:asparagine synthase (glutamine-hydrolyzing) [Hamadaea tsunoensis]